MADTRRTFTQVGTPTPRRAVDISTGATAPLPERLDKGPRTRLSENNKRLSESLLDLVWTLVDNGVVSVDDAAPMIEVLADIIDGRETK